MRESLLSFMLIASVWAFCPATFVEAAESETASDPDASRLSCGSPESVRDDSTLQRLEKTVDMLASRANDWKEPSPRSEEIYVQAIRDWLDSLPQNKRALARQILREAHPSLKTLREAIRDKKAELAALSFSRDTRPETLPRLGQELQGLRRSLRDELEKLGERLRIEAGVQMGPLGGDGFWLAPPSASKS